MEIKKETKSTYVQHLQRKIGKQKNKHSRAVTSFQRFEENSPGQAKTHLYGTPQYINANETQATNTKEKSKRMMLQKNKQKYLLNDQN